MERDDEKNLWCHTCKQVFRRRLDNNFNYKCPCGSEFIEEISNANDPRLFDNVSRQAQDTVRQNRNRMDSPGDSFHISSQSSSGFPRAVDYLPNLAKYANGY